MIDDDIETLKELNGLHVALLDEQEKSALDRLISAGLAIRDYSGAAGFFGIARVSLQREQE